MKRTNLGICYVEGDDRRMDFPNQMKEMAEKIDGLFCELFRRVDRIEAEVQALEQEARTER